MKHLQTFKYELRTDGQQERQMRCFAGSCRFVFNKALALQKERFDAGEKKLGWMRYRHSREVVGMVKNITVSLSCGKWFVSIQTEREVEQPIPKGGAVGIDMA
jgi:putative transposase